jgi:hypothetical protein
MIELQPGGQVGVVVGEWLRRVVSRLLGRDL